MRRTVLQSVGAALLVVLGGFTAALADSQKLFAAPPASQAAAPSGAGSMAQATLALVVVLIAVFAAAYFLRRLRKFGPAGGTHGIEIVSQAALGSKERAVLLKVAGAHVLVGVAPGTVSLLHVLDATSIPPQAEGESSAPKTALDANAPTFKSLLRKSLGMQ